MSTRNAVYKLEKELAFWQRVHQHEAMDEREFRLEDQIRQLENRDEFGIPRYNGHIEDDYDDCKYEYIPQPIGCKYCGKVGMEWKQVNGKWRLFDSGTLHVCKQYFEHTETITCHQDK
jgi:hypothetical protein